METDKLAPVPKKAAGSTGKSGASLSGKSLVGKSGGLGSTGKFSNFGSTGTKSSNFGSNISKTSTFGSTASKTSTFGSTQSKSTFGALSPVKNSSAARSPSFFGAAPAKVPSGHTPSTSKKTYDSLSFNPKTEKSSTSFGIIWIPGRKRNKKKDLVYSSINYDKKNERTPTMYSIMSGDSPDYQLHKKKDEELSLLVPEKMKGPIATAASAGAAATILEVPSDLGITDPEEKHLIHDKEETKEAAGDSNNKEDVDYLENNDVPNKFPTNKQDKSSDKVDSVMVLASTQAIKPPPPQSTTSNPDEDDCVIKCLYYTLQCCDCVLM